VESYQSRNSFQTKQEGMSRAKSG